MARDEKMSELISAQESLLRYINAVIQGIEIAQAIYPEKSFVTSKFEQCSKELRLIKENWLFLKENTERLDLQQEPIRYTNRVYAGAKDKKDYIGWINSSLQRIHSDGFDTRMVDKEIKEYIEILKETSF